MTSTQTLIAGFTSYASAEELVSTSLESAPGATPSPISAISVFLTASSAECGLVSVGVTAGGTTTTLAAGC